MWVRVPQGVKRKGIKEMGQQEKYLEEYEKYKHVVITLGQYVHKESKTIYIITNINLQENYV